MRRFEHSIPLMNGGTVQYIKKDWDITDENYSWPGRTTLTARFSCLLSCPSSR